MQFEFEGEYYRIGFRHDKPVDRRWEKHRGHDVRLVQVEFDRVGLYCALCAIKLSHLTDREKGRQTACIIYSNTAGPDEKPAWTPRFQAAGILNVAAGDQFNRAAGRKAALTRCLQGIPHKPFREAAWRAYWSSCPGGASEASETSVAPVAGSPDCSNKDLSSGGAA